MVLNDNLETFLFFFTFLHFTLLTLYVTTHKSEFWTEKLRLNILLMNWNSIHLWSFLLFSLLFWQSDQAVKQSDRSDFRLPVLYFKLIFLSIDYRSFLIYSYAGRFCLFWFCLWLFSLSASNFPLGSQFSWLIGPIHWYLIKNIFKKLNILSDYYLTIPNWKEEEWLNYQWATQIIVYQLTITPLITSI